MKLCAGPQKACAMFNENYYAISLGTHTHIYIHTCSNSHNVQLCAPFWGWHAHTKKKKKSRKTKKKRKKSSLDGTMLGAQLNGTTLPLPLHLLLAPAPWLRGRKDSTSKPEHKFYAGECFNACVCVYMYTCVCVCMYVCVCWATHF